MRCFPVDVREVIERHLPERYAQQIARDTRSPTERMRDRTLRVMAEDERRRLEKLDPIGTAVPLPPLEPWSSGVEGYASAAARPDRGRSESRISRPLTSQ